MERAREIWRELQLPALELRSPWYGYQLGAWTRELEEEARLAVEGRHLETGAKLKNVRKRID
jgi:4-hydroxy-3-polyprenylbenzoate decarboxylase